VQQLEQLTGELLFHRNTRQIRLTQFGQQFYQDCRQQLVQLEQLLSPRAASNELSGEIRLAAPAAMRSILAPLLIEFAQLHPHIGLDLRLSDQHSAVVDEQIDLGIRAGLLRDQSFVAVPLSEVALWLVASPNYLKQFGQPATLDDLAQHQQVSMLDNATGKPWIWFFKDGATYQPRKVRYLVNDAEQELAAATAGLGLAQVADFLAAPQIKHGALVRLLKHHEPTPWPLSLYRPQRGPVSARVRLLFDFLRKRLSV
jgi:DNA-binding transcriptional LysR family regulator